MSVSHLARVASFHCGFAHVIPLLLTCCLEMYVLGGWKKHKILSSPLLVSTAAERKISSFSWFGFFLIFSVFLLLCGRLSVLHILACFLLLLCWTSYTFVTFMYAIMQTFCFPSCVFCLFKLLFIYFTSNLFKPIYFLFLDAGKAFWKISSCF